MIFSLVDVIASLIFAIMAGGTSIPGITVVLGWRGEGRERGGAWARVGGRRGAWWRAGWRHRGTLPDFRVLDLGDRTNNASQPQSTARRDDFWEGSRV